MFAFSAPSRETGKNGTFPCFSTNGDCLTSFLSPVFPDKNPEEKTDCFPIVFSGQRRSGCEIRYTARRVTSMRLIKAEPPFLRMMRLLKEAPNAIRAEREWRRSAPKRGTWRQRWIELQLRVRGIDVRYSNVSPDLNEAVNWLWYARQFADAAWACRNTARNAPWLNLPAYYLLAHAIELALKAHLLNRSGSTTADVRRFGHDLRRLLAEVEKGSLFGEDWRIGGYLDVLREIVLLNANNIFRYPSDHSSAIPQLHTITFVVRRLILQVEASNRG